MRGISIEHKMQGMTKLFGINTPNSMVTYYSFYGTLAHKKRTPFA